MKTLPLAIAALLAVSPAAAQSPVSVPRFDSIELQGGGEVTVRHGATQRVNLLRGSREMTGFTVERGQLKIDTCIRDCHNYDLRVEIVTPDLDGLSIRNGGRIVVLGDFPAQADLAVAVSQGGEIDARAIAARDVAASVSRGGLIRTDARETLAASINSGGSISYVGNPETSVAINGGGSVNRDSGR
jgi:hypothetical protein